MNQYPEDHPLWQDVNFCPDWLYKHIQAPQEAAVQHRQQQRALPGEREASTSMAPHHSRACAPESETDPRWYHRHPHPPHANEQQQMAQTHYSGYAPLSEQQQPVFRSNEAQYGYHAQHFVGSSPLMIPTQHQLYSSNGGHGFMASPQAPRLMENQMHQGILCMHNV